MKNKLNFFLSALLMLLFGMGLNTCSLAVEPDYTDFEIPVEFWDNLIDYINDNIDLAYQGGTIDKTLVTPENLKTFYDNNIKNNLKSHITSMGGDDRNIILAIKNRRNASINSQKQVRIYFLSSNNTIGSINNDYSFYITDSSDILKYSIYGVNQSVYTLEIDRNNQLSTYFTQPDSILYWLYNSDQISDLTINNGPFFGVNQKPLNIINFKPYNSAGYSNYFINGFYNINPLPENPDNPDEPSGDVPGTGGSTGTITNPSGDTTGKVDLSGIEQGIGNINQNLNNIVNKIPTSGEIKDSQVAGNKEFWGNEEDIDPEDFENELENNFNGIMENLSGELTQNKIYKSLEGAEDGFLNFFREEQNEQFYDLAFSWPDIEYMGGVIIPAGGINISEMCREIPELETLRSYIRVIFNFTVAIALIKQIYNLILSTLGIDNPYLYEDSSMETEVFEDMDTGQSYFTYSGRATDGSRYRIRSNHTNVKKHNKIGF